MMLPFIGVGNAQRQPRDRGFVQAKLDGEQLCFRSVQLQPPPGPAAQNDVFVVAVA